MTEDKELLNAFKEGRVVLKNKKYPSIDNELATFLNAYFLRPNGLLACGDVVMYACAYKDKNFTWTGDVKLRFYPQAVLMTLNEARNFFRTVDSFPIY